MSPMLVWKWGREVGGGGEEEVYAYILALYELIIIYT